MRVLGYALVATLAFGTGVVTSSFAGKAAVPHAMFKEIHSDIDHARTVDTIKARIRAQEGWSLVAEVDQRQAILDGGGEDIGPYTILKFCSAEHSGRMLSDDERRFFGVMMPISVAVYTKDDGTTWVSLLNGGTLSHLMGGTYQDVVSDVRYDVEEIFQFLHLSFDSWS